MKKKKKMLLKSERLWNNIFEMPAQQLNANLSNKMHGPQEAWSQQLILPYTARPKDESAMFHEYMNTTQLLTVGRDSPSCIIHACGDALRMGWL